MNICDRCKLRTICCEIMREICTLNNEPYTNTALDKLSAENDTKNDDMNELNYNTNQTDRN